MLRAELLAKVAARLAALELGHPTRVGIDGCDAAGKTTFADDLGRAMGAQGRSAIRASIAGFHDPASVRYQRGRESGDGYFLDSFDNDAVIRELLDPFGPGGSLRYRRAVFDFRTDRAVDSPSLTAAVDAVLLFDGVFLHRDELAP